MTEIIRALINESILHDQIVHVRRDRLTNADMLALGETAEDTALINAAREDGSATRQFWGADEDGDEWRVHVEGIDGANDNT